MDTKGTILPALAASGSPGQHAERNGDRTASAWPMVVGGRCGGPMRWTPPLSVQVRHSCPAKMKMPIFRPATAGNTASLGPASNHWDVQPQRWAPLPPPQQDSPLAVQVRGTWLGQITFDKMPRQIRYQALVNYLLLSSVFREMRVISPSILFDEVQIFRAARLLISPANHSR